MQYATKIIMNSDAASKATPIHVLHVDDDAPFLDLSRQILADMGNFEVDNACSVDEAFEKLAACKYDIIVSDYEMPQKSGLQFLKELRSQNSDIPFILFTGKGREEIAMLALNLGADGYFNKQGDPETVYGELAHMIKQNFERKNWEQALKESEEKFRNLSEGSPHMIFINHKGKVVYINQKCETALGYTKEEFYSDEFNFLSLISPEYVETLKLAWTKHIKGEEVPP